jgi:hypothetical protein
VTWHHGQAVYVTDRVRNADETGEGEHPAGLLLSVDPDPQTGEAIATVALEVKDGRWRVQLRAPKATHYEASWVQTYYLKRCPLSDLILDKQPDAEAVSKAAAMLCFDAGLAHMTGRRWDTDELRKLGAALALASGVPVPLDPAAMEARAS